MDPRHRHRPPPAKATRPTARYAGLLVCPAGLAVDVFVRLDCVLTTAPFVHIALSVPRGGL